MRKLWQALKIATTELAATKMSPVANCRAHLQAI